MFLVDIHRRRRKILRVGKDPGRKTPSYLLGKDPGRKTPSYLLGKDPKSNFESNADRSLSLSLSLSLVVTVNVKQVQNAVTL